MDVTARFGDVELEGASLVYQATDPDDGALRARLDATWQSAPGSSPDRQPVDLDDATLRQLRLLGYIE